MKAYQLVSCSSKTCKVDAGLQAVFSTHLAGTVDLPDRAGLTQALTYECINLAAVGSTNVWMHFQKRVLAYTRTCFALPEDDYKKLSKEVRTARKLALMQASGDVCRLPTEALRSPPAYHVWVTQTRSTLGIDSAVGADWGGKPLLYHLKTHPHRFVAAMHTMSTAQHAAGRKAFALFPLRRSHVPGHMRFDQMVLGKLLGLDAAKEQKKAKARALAQQPETSAATGRAPKRKRGDPSLVQEKAAIFNEVLSLRAAGVHRRHHFAFAFTTDGVSLHLGMQTPGKQSGKASKLAHMPTRGIHSIDELKHASRGQQLHTVGIDPGKRELVVAVDRDDPRNKPVVRYTLAQRRRDLRTRQFADALRRSKLFEVTLAEEALSLHNSKAPSLRAFAEYAAKRREVMRECPELQTFYSHDDHRKRRRKTRIKTQQSEARLVKRLSAMHSKEDSRPLVLAYGAWGLVAGRPNMAGNRGTPPAVGAGLMKRLAIHFVVSPTPEHYTSKTCVRCMGCCGPHPTLKTKEGKEIRGLRACQREGCGLLQNRDKTGATNIGLQFQRLLQGESSIKAMSEEELEFHRLAVCTECCD